MSTDKEIILQLLSLLDEQQALINDLLEAFHSDETKLSPAVVEAAARTLAKLDRMKLNLVKYVIGKSTRLN